ncbi:MAG: hypothetical protein CMJ83_13005, partial [Planctomycetes bacterium]|nr:hypothetical protein [Planctomycetota bacterium]
MSARHWIHPFAGLVALLVTAGFVSGQAQPRLWGRWVFDGEHVKGTRVTAATGRVHGTIKSADGLRSHPALGGLALGGGHRVVLADDLAKLKLPATALSVSAWVTVDRSQPWGGIVSALQDNGGFEQGWLLGFRNASFCFAISSKGGSDGDGLLTYLTAPSAFVLGRRHHVVGTYDGKVMRLYVDGGEVASSKQQKGPILYPAHAPFEIGAYHDKDENFPLSGIVQEVAIHDRALAPATIAATWTRRAAALKPIARPPVAGWTFRSEHLADGAVRAFGAGPALPVEGEFTIDDDTGPWALHVGPKGGVGVLPVTDTVLPAKALSLEAWVRLEAQPEWSGFLGTIDDDRGRQAGALLGSRKDRFAFGLASQGADDGNGRMTWVMAPGPFEPGRWYHVCGTYDGVGQALYVDGELMSLVRVQHGAVIRPASSPFVVGSFRDQDEDHRLPGRLHTAAVFDHAVDAATVRVRFNAGRRAMPQGLRLRAGPIVRHVAPDAVMVSWETRAPGSTVVRWGPGKDMSRVVRDKTPKHRHQVTLQGVAPDTVHGFVVATVREGKRAEQASPRFTFDSTFEYLPVKSPRRPSPWPDDALTPVYRRAAEHILATSGVSQGFCLVLGSEEGRLAWELAQRTDLKIIALEPDARKVARSRQALQKTGLYGARISVHRMKLDSDLPYTDWFANLIVSDRLLLSGKVPAKTSEIVRLLRPCGGAVVFGTRKKTSASRLKRLTGAPRGQAQTLDADEGAWVMWRRPALDGARDWTHQYASPDNSACSQDELARGAMEVLWYGRPGPRPMVDRGARNPAPLSANGRLFVQGDRILFGLDAYNGTILWSLFAPQLVRANIPRDGSNMVATDDALLVAVDDGCWELDGQTGVRRALHPLPLLPSSHRHQWGFLAHESGLMVGSAVKEGSSFVAGQGQWYDKAGSEAFKVASDWLFALDRQSPNPRWIYRKGVIINATITIAKGRVYFIESRDEKAVLADVGRLGQPVLRNTFLVCLDLGSGEMKWEKAVDVTRAERSLYLAWAKDTLVLTTTKDRYEVQAFDAKTGAGRWAMNHRMARDHHGGAFQHPVIVG